MPGPYYSNMILGNNQGKVTIDFIQTLFNAGVLSSDCTIQFARHDKMDSRWTNSMRRIQDKLDTRLTFVHEDSNVLFQATRVVGAGPMNHEEHLHYLTANVTPSFCQLHIGALSPGGEALPPPRTTGPRTRSSAVTPATPATGTSSVTTGTSSGARRRLMLGSNLSPEGLKELLPLQQSRSADDDTSEYVSVLERKIDQLAVQKRRLQLKFAKARVVITKIIENVEKDLGPMSAKDKREYWEDLESDNPIELSPDVTEPVLTELNGLVYPNNWGGTAKYNLTKLTMTKKTCTTLYGFPVEFEWLQFLITHVYFPGMSPDRSSCEDDMNLRSSMELNTKLTEFEQALATLQFFKSGEQVIDTAHHWGVERRVMGRYLQTWSRKWSDVAKVFCRLDPSASMFDKMQPVDYDYPCKMACETDGSLVDIGTSRKYSSKSRSSFADKSGSQAGQGLTWTSCIGLVILVTALFCVRVSEKEMVRLHRTWLGIFPEGYGRLVDRGFTFCTQFYPNLNQAFSPAHVNRKTGDLTHRQVIDARRQSADRYTCEVVYSRVKQFRILTGRCPVSRLQFLPSAWLVAHMAANFYKPLRAPDYMSEWSDAKLQSAYL